MSLFVRRALPALLALAVLLPTPAAASARTTAAACPARDVVPTRATLPAVREAVRCLLNAERRARGRRPLRAGATLRRAAQAHSADMAARGYFRHVSPEGATLTARVLRRGYARGGRRWLLGENLAWATGGRATAAGVVAGWMRSPGHRRNLLGRRFREVGVGIVLRAPGGGAGRVRAIYTADFGRRSGPARRRGR